MRYEPQNRVLQISSLQMRACWGKISSVQTQPFDRTKHVYSNADLVELIKDAVRFFNGTPVISLPLTEKFIGSGVYAFYYTGTLPLYDYYYESNRTSYNAPIYIGKAVPRGWRQSRTTNSATQTELFSRLREHVSGLSATGFNISDFKCRFVVFEDSATAMIGTIEAAIINQYMPLWNSCIDGFGNHDPGKGRYKQEVSDWDVLHAGRGWAKKCNQGKKTHADIAHKVKNYLQKGLQ